MFRLKSRSVLCTPSSGLSRALGALNVDDENDDDDAMKSSARDDDDVDVDVDDDDDDVSHPAGMTAPSSSPGTQSQSIVALLMP